MSNALEESRLLGGGLPVYATLTDGDLVLVTNVFTPEGDELTDLSHPDAFEGEVIAALCGVSYLFGAWVAVDADQIIMLGTGVGREVMH
jgi:hypothetical protein